jgi:guanylate kinase
MGPLIIISGPSGSGKTTVVAELLKQTRLPLRRAVTATTRPKRPGEIDEKDYHFWTHEQFEREVANNGLLEHALVHQRDYYGTPRMEVDPYLQQDIGVVLVIDVQGAAQVRRLYPNCFSVLLRIPDDRYEERLLARGDDPASIARRMTSAQLELERCGEYNVQLLNDRLADTVSQLEAMIAGQFARAQGENACSKT